MSTAADAMLTMLPPRSAMTRAAARQPKKTPFRLMPSTRSSSSSVTSATSCSCMIPALLTTTSSRPWSRAVPSMSASTSSARDTSVDGSGDGEPRVPEALAHGGDLGPGKRAAEADEVQGQGHPALGVEDRRRHHADPVGGGAVELEQVVLLVPEVLDHGVDVVAVPQGPRQAQAGLGLQ